MHKGMLANTYAACLTGVEARLIDVQVHMGQGLPGFELVGLAETAVKESRVRVRSAIVSQNMELPAQKIVVNLAPADLKKTGSAFDLAIAIGLLAGTGRCALERLSETLLLGELTLGGRLSYVRGLLAYLKSAEKSGLRFAVVPAMNASEAAFFTHYAPHIDVRVADTLGEVVAFLSKEIELTKVSHLPRSSSTKFTKDFSEIKGQSAAKRVLQIGAAGDHHILMVGPPGAGKTMLAERWGTIMPAPSPTESLEIATVASIAGLGLEWSTCDQGGFLTRPFRAPHHSATHVALLGGGDPIFPGEITLAHGGVLFLDELAEFARPAIEALRITMESGVVRIARARQRVTLPAKPRVIAAMNPCPCGYAGESKRVCVCSPIKIANYQNKISGPVLDRFDLQMIVSGISSDELSSTTADTASTSSAYRASVEGAQRFRAQREAESQSHAPFEDAGAGELIQLTRYCTQTALGLLNQAFDKLAMSPRVYVKVLRIGRTIADLASSTSISREHIAEALQYRLLDRRNAAPGF